MEHQTDFLEKLEKHSRQQLLFTKILCALCAVLMVCMLVLTVSIAGVTQEVVALVKPLKEVTGQVQSVAAQVNDMSGQAATIMNNMETVTQALADADLSSMVENVNTLTAESQSVVTEAMEKLDTIDIDTLNKAILDLADVVEPLAKLTKLFG